MKEVEDENMQTFDEIIDVIFEDFIGMVSYFARCTGENYRKIPFNNFAEYLVHCFEQKIKNKDYDYISDDVVIKRARDD